MSKDIEATNSRGDESVSGLFDWEGAADFLCVTPRMVRELWARRELAGIKVGKHVRFHQSDLDRYVSDHRVETDR